MPVCAGLDALALETGARVTGMGHRDPTAARPVLGVEAAAKRFGEVQALQDVSIALSAGEVHGLVGDSRAGKSTLVKVLGGEYDLDGGHFVVDGEPTVWRAGAAARAVGASIVHQWPHLLPDMGVAENIFRGRRPSGAGPGFDRAELRRQSASIFARLGVEIDPARPVRRLSVADKQIVEIARAVSLDARVVLMDESTVPLSPVEAGRLFRVIRALRDDGVAVLFASLNMDEIFGICQRVSVIRGGRLVHTAAVDEITSDEVVHLAAGRRPGETFVNTGPTGAGAVLEVGGLSQQGAFSGVSFQVRSGEVVALAGAGSADVAGAVFGIGRRDAGHVTVRGRELPNGPRAAIDNGVVFVREGGSQHGLPPEPVFDDDKPWPTSLRRRAGTGLVRRVREQVPGTRWAALRRLKDDRVNDSARQSVRSQLEWLIWSSAQPPAVLIIDDPTRGTDLGNTRQVHWLLDKLAVDGVAILLVSSDLPEIVAMADRVLVLRAGRLVADLPHRVADEASIKRAMGPVP